MLPKLSRARSRSRISRTPAAVAATGAGICAGRYALAVQSSVAIIGTVIVFVTVFVTVITSFTVTILRL
jgi:hypothetical protein